MQRAQYISHSTAEDQPHSIISLYMSCRGLLFSYCRCWTDTCSSLSSMHSKCDCGNESVTVLPFTTSIFAFEPRYKAADDIVYIQYKSTFSPPAGSTFKSLNFLSTVFKNIMSTMPYEEGKYSLSLPSHWVFLHFTLRCCEKPHDVNICKHISTLPLFNKTK